MRQGSKGEEEGDAICRTTSDNTSLQGDHGYIECPLVLAQEHRSKCKLGTICTFVVISTRPGEAETSRWFGKTRNNDVPPQSDGRGAEIG
jgi:hypothetical protein